MVAAMIEHFRRTVEIAAPAAVVWAFHERPDALQLLTPAWMKVEVVTPPRSLEVGTRVELRMHVGPVPIKIVAVHVKYEAGRMFADRMTRGPFKSWLHHHIVEATATGARLIDDVEYELPGGWLGRTVAGGAVRRAAV
jgi:ligand-binding SRPBCC domain-containing protein